MRLIPDCFSPWIILVACVIRYPRTLDFGCSLPSQETSLYLQMKSLLTVEYKYKRSHKVVISF
jgi:hypothetical protein